MTKATLNLASISNLIDDDSHSLEIESQSDSESGQSTESSLERVPFSFKIINPKSQTYERKREGLDLADQRILKTTKKLEEISQSPVTNQSPE